MRPPPLERAIEDYLTYLRVERGLSPATIRAYRGDLADFASGRDVATSWADGPDAAEPDAALPDRIEQLLARHRLAPRQLILELTESATGNRPEVALEVMQRLRTLGVSLALDDFGTGFSTLSRLAFTPADIVKIDRGYVVDIDHDAQRRRFLAGVLELTRSLGLRTVAEGVEREGQLQELRRLGCDLVQGNHTGPPRSEQDITALLLDDGSVLTLGPVGSPIGRATSPA